MKTDTNIMDIASLDLKIVGITGVIAAFREKEEVLSGRKVWDVTPPQSFVSRINRQKSSGIDLRF